MITVDKIWSGICNGTVRLVTDPNMEAGTVCQIGDTWFYFGGETAEEESPESYIKNVPMADIVNEIFDTLENFKADGLQDEYGYYDAVLDEADGLHKSRAMIPLYMRDKELETIWDQFGDVPMDPETEKTAAAFLHFPAGTEREEIWHWFDERHSKGVAYLLYGGTEDYVPETRRLYGLKKLCTECDAEHCVFNPKGICLFPMVGERAPQLSDDGCKDFCYKEEL